MKLLTMPHHHHHHHHPKLSQNSRRKIAPAQRFVRRWTALGYCLVLLTAVLVVFYANLLRKAAVQHWSITTMSTTDLWLLVPPPNRLHHHPQPGGNGNEGAAAERQEKEEEELRAAALSYVQSFRNLGKEGKLAFLHIPKTAGTAVELAAGRQKINWGSCAFPHRPKRAICHYRKKLQDNGNQTIITTKDWPNHIGWWHLPPFMFPIVQPATIEPPQPRDDNARTTTSLVEVTTKKSSRRAAAVWVDPYQNAELFGIVRHPYERMLSEYHYICTLKITSWRPDQCDRSKLHDAQYMNEWLRAKLLLQKQSDDDIDEKKDQQQPQQHAISSSSSSSSSQYYWQDNGHFTSQYDFVFGPHQVRRLDYVLRMEDLNVSFPRLAAAYFNPPPPPPGQQHPQQQQPMMFRLEHRNAIGAAQRSSSTDQGVTTTAALDAETVRAIRQLYRQDFALGRYDDEEEEKSTAAAKKAS